MYNFSLSCSYVLHSCKIGHLLLLLYYITTGFLFLLKKFIASLRRQFRFTDVLIIWQFNSLITHFLFCFSHILLFLCLVSTARRVWLPNLILGVLARAVSWEGNLFLNCGPPPPFRPFTCAHQPVCHACKTPTNSELAAERIARNLECSNFIFYTWVWEIFRYLRRRTKGIYGVFRYTHSISRGVRKSLHKAGINYELVECMKTMEKREKRARGYVLCFTPGDLSIFSI